METGFRYSVVLRTNEGLKSYLTDLYRTRLAAWKSFYEIYSFLKATGLDVVIVEYHLIEDNGYATGL